MSDDPAVILPLLRVIRLFDGLDDAQLAQVAQAAELITLEDEQSPLLDEEQDYPFFVVASGKISLVAPQGDNEEEHILKKGDFFGAEVLFLGRRAEYQIIAIIPAQLISISAERTRILVQTIPRLQDNLKTQLRIYRLVRSRHFNWLSEDETVLLIRRKHPAYLLITLLAPLGMAWLAFMIYLFGSQIGVSSFRLVVEWLAYAGLALSVLWAIWRVVDYTNDFYVVTDERIVWLERVVGLYDSRQEAPLAVIKAGETRSDFIGRTLGYGDVITEALMGKVVFRHVGNPTEIKDLIDHQRSQALVRQSQSDSQAMELAIRRKIEPPPPAPAEGSTLPTAPTVAQIPDEPAPETVSSPNLGLFNFFRTRVEEGEVITYRKHLFILFTRTWLPLLSSLGVAVATLFFFWESVNRRITFPTPLTILFTGMLAFIVPSLWWLYNFIDWRNDIYRITPDRIIDSERKPLGDEVSKSAPLENILSMDYERLGILGVVLNFGNVIINVGAENRFVFFGIHNPARAQSDIFNHIITLRRRKQLTNATQEWERVSDWLAAYHRQSEEMRQSRNPPRI